MACPVSKAIYTPNPFPKTFNNLLPLTAGVFPSFAPCKNVVSAAEVPIALRAAAAPPNNAVAPITNILNESISPTNGFIDFTKLSTVNFASSSNLVNLFLAI